MLANNTSGVAAVLIARVCKPFDKIELTNTSFTGRRYGFASDGAMISAKLIIGRIAITPKVATPKAITPSYKLQYGGPCDRIQLFDYSTCGFTEYPLRGLLPDCDFHRQPVALQADPLVTKCMLVSGTTSMMLDAHHRRNDYIKCSANNPLGRALWACLRAKINAIWQLFGPDYPCVAGGLSIPVNDLRALVYAWFLRTKW